MGMHLFNVKRLFRRRKYDRVLGQDGRQDLVPSPHPHDHHNNELQLHHHQETHAKSNGPPPPPPPSSWSFKMPSKFRLHKQKSSRFASVSPAAAAPPTLAAVQNFLDGPAGDDEVYQQQCRDLLRKLSARGNRVPGFV